MKNRIFRLAALALAGQITMAVLPASAQTNQPVPEKDSRTGTVTALHEHIMLARLAEALRYNGPETNVQEGITGLSRDRFLMKSVEDDTAYMYFRQAELAYSDPQALMDFNFVPCRGLSDAAYKMATQIINHHLVKNDRRPREWSKKMIMALLAPLRPIYSLPVSLLMITNEKSLDARTGMVGFTALACNQGREGYTPTSDIIKYVSPHSPTVKRRQPFG